ncbi:MAG: hypothetical protein JW807_07365 [Spirochaetes bacterium]|nr:hypothetical protein [Spirochaetota bacterium]
MKQTCVRHPERTGKYFCSKYNEFLCDECLSCRDPKGYCKFRTSCVIHEIQKHGPSINKEE